MSDPLVSMEGIDKSFPGVRALDPARFELRAGEVHALVALEHDHLVGDPVELGRLVAPEVNMRVDREDRHAATAGRGQRSIALL